MILLLTVLSATFINKLNNETKISWWPIIIPRLLPEMQIALDNDLFAPFQPNPI